LCIYSGDDPGDNEVGGRGIEEQVASMNMTRKFMDALDTLERYGDVDYITSLFSDQCDIGNAVSPNTFVGREGAIIFWSTYRSWFREVQSTIHKMVVQDGRSAIEWTSTGTTARGHVINYEGLTILEFEGDLITRFRAYFNPQALIVNADATHPLASRYLDPFG
jgi:hypothetical protein